MHIISSTRNVPIIANTTKLLLWFVCIIMAHLYLTIIILLATDTAMSYYDVINTYSKLRKYDHSIQVVLYKIWISAPSSSKAGHELVTTVADPAASQRNNQWHAELYAGCTSVTNLMHLYLLGSSWWWLFLCSFRHDTWADPRGRSAGSGWCWTLGLWGTCDGTLGRLVQMPR